MPKRRGPGAEVQATLRQEPLSVAAVRHASLEYSM